MTQLNRGNVFRLEHSSGNSYIGFVRGGRDLLTLVFFDHETNKLKTLTGFSANNKNVTKLTKEDMPEPLKKAYDECFISVKKGKTVTFTLDGVDYTGVVIKGGANPKVELYINGNPFYTSGPAIFFTVVEE